MRKMTLEEARQLLATEGYEYLGCRDFCDCRIDYWCKPAKRRGKFYVAIVDGWWGDYKPRVRIWSAEELERLKTMLM